MKRMSKIIKVSLDGWLAPEESENLYDGRKHVVAGMRNGNIEATIIVLAFNRLEKTRECIRSILEYTQDVKYKLLLIDNGSNDEGETLRFFQDVPYKDKVIFHIDRNYGANTPFKFIYEQITGRYLAIVANDIIVTSRWLSNMIKIAESDDKIGMVNPMSSNVSNLQERRLQFQSYEEMQKIAEKINISDRTAWHERLRLVTLGTMYTSECLYAIGWPIGDVGFFHDFVDDDITFRVRRSGYKAILAGDTWIHHNHDFRVGEDKEPGEYEHSINIGRKNFKDKYFGIDAWEDVNNYIPMVLPFIKETSSQYAGILGIDVKCGTPILEIKNKLRKYSSSVPLMSAFTQESKYEIDLKSICNGIVACDREEFLKGYFTPQCFDYIYIGRHINRYHEPLNVLLDALSLLKTGGKVFVTLKNAFDIMSFLRIIGVPGLFDAEYCINYSCEVFENAMKGIGCEIQCIGSYKKSLELDNQSQQWLHQTIKGMSFRDSYQVEEQLMTDYWVYEIKKIKV